MDEQQFEEIAQLIAMRANLVHSIEQAHELRDIARQWILGKRFQQLTAQHPVEKAHLITALVEVLSLRNLLKKTLIVANTTQTIENIFLSFQLHTDLSLWIIEEDMQSPAQVNFVTFKNFFEIYSYRKLHTVLPAFDLIVLIDADKERNQIFLHKLNTHYQHWILDVEMPKPRHYSL